MSRVLSSYFSSFIPSPRLFTTSRKFPTSAPKSRHLSHYEPIQCEIQKAQSGRMARKKVGAVIIGNEILNGKTVDTNLSTLAKYVDSKGAILQHAVTIRDDIDIIAKYVRDMSQVHELVFTSGGIGPTLDDVTYAGVAAAFSLPLSRHEETIQRMKQSRPKMELNSARIRMAELPEGCETLWTDELWVPLAVVRNVYILPGIPRLFEHMLQSVPDERFGQVARRTRVIVLCEMAEGDLAELLERVSHQFEDVLIGSYPATTEEARKRYRSMITLEGDLKDNVAHAAEIVRDGVGGHFEQDVV